MDGIARTVRQAYHQLTLDGDTHTAHRAPAVVLHDGGYHVIGGELVANALVRRIRDGSKGIRSVSVCISEQCEASAGDRDVQIDSHSYPDGVTLFDDPDALQARILSALNAEGTPETLQTPQIPQILETAHIPRTTCSGDQVSGAARGGGPTTRHLVAIDGGISSLMLRHGTRRIARLVEAIRRNPNTYCVVLGCVHDDLHDEHDLSLLCQDPIAEAHVLTKGRQSGRVLIKLATTKGCKKTERCTFEIAATGDIAFHKDGDEAQVLHRPPPPASLASKSTSERLEAEKKAKRNVVLPYERQGHAKEYAADADFREYLPVEAGGWMRGHQSRGGEGNEGYKRGSEQYKHDEDEGDDMDDGDYGRGKHTGNALDGNDAALERTTHRLGTINYLRGDSDDDSFDSDEDPDDDIDI